MATEPTTAEKIRNILFQKQGNQWTRRYPTAPTNPARYTQTNPDVGRPSQNYPRELVNPYAGTPFESDDNARYAPTGKPEEWQEMGLKTPDAQVDTNNFLAGWDYQNPPVGPDGRPLDYNNSPLPEGATGFTPYGDPDFTPEGRNDLAAVFEGWFKGMQYRLWKDVDLTEQGKNPFVEASERTASLLETGQFAEGLKASWDTLMQIGPGLRALQTEEGDPTTATLAGRTIAEVGRGVGSAFGLFAKTAESLIGTGQLTAAQAQEGSPLPEVDYPDWVPGWAQVFANSMGPLAAYNSLRTLTAPKKSWDAAIDALDENWQASRIAYSVINDDNLKDEYVRRLKAGEDPRYLAMELEKPLDEMVGQLIFDPLNIAGFFTKSGAMARRFANLEDIYLKPAQGVDDAFRALRAGNIQEGVNSLQNMAQAVQTEIRAVANNLDTLATNRGLTQLTTTGKRMDLVNRSGQMVRFIFANTRKANGAYDFDRAMEIMRGMVNMADPNNLDNVAAAVNDVVKGAQVPRPLFSRAGMETAVMLRSLFDTGASAQGELATLGRGLDFDGFLRGFEQAKAGGLDEVIAWATSKLDEGAKGYFPTVLEQAKAADRLAEYQRTGQIVLGKGETLADVQRAARYGKVSPVVQMVARFDETTKGKIYAPINRFFANVYMGMSPGFAFRNLMNNALTIAVDAGPGSIFVGKEKALGGIRSLLGGVTNTKLGGFAGAAKGVEGAVDAEKGLKWWQAGLQLSEKFEEIGAAQVSYKAVKDAMRRMLRPGYALPDVAPLVDAGMNLDTANLLSRLVTEFDGNVNAAVARFRELAAPGNIDITRTLGWLSEDDLRIAAQFNLDDQIRTILTGEGTLSEKKTALQALVSGKEEFAALSQNEMTGVTDMLQQAEGREVAVAATNATAEGLMSDAEGALVNHRIWSNAYAKRTYEELIASVREQGWEVVRQSNPELANQIPATLKPVQDRMNDTWARALSEHDDFTRSVVARSSEVKSGKGAATFAQLWEEFKFEGDLPANLTKDEFLDILWNHWRNTTRTRFATAREAYVSLAEAGWQEVARVTGYAPDKKIIDRAREYLRTARAYDDALVETTSKGPLVFQKRDMILSALNRNDNAQAIRVLADHYGIPTATSKGAPLDNIVLAVLKKYGNEAADLANTTLDDAWKAFEAQRAGKNKGTLIGDLDQYLGRAPGGSLTTTAPFTQMNEQELVDEITDAGNAVQDVATKNPSRSATLNKWKRSKPSAVSAKEVLSPEAIAAKERLANAELELDLLRGGRNEAVDQVLKKYPAPLDIPTWAEGDKVLRTSAGEFTRVGSGGFKTVYGRPDSDFVIKVSKISDPLEEAALMDKYADTGLFPKIVGTGSNQGNLAETFYYSIVEKVETFSATQAENVLKQLPDVGYDLPGTGIQVSPLTKEFKAFLEQVADLLGQGDLKNLENWGRAPDGRLVVLDARDWKTAARETAIQQEIKNAQLAMAQNPITRAAGQYIDEDAATGFSSIEEAVAALEKRRKLLLQVGTPENNEHVIGLGDAIERLKALAGAETTPVVTRTRTPGYQTQASFTRMKRPVIATLGNAPQVDTLRVTEAVKPATQNLTPLPTPYMDGSMPTGPRGTAENLAGMRKWLDDLSTRLEQNAGRLTPADLSPEVEGALTSWASKATEGVGEARLLASSYADLMRDFALHDYSAKRNIDLLAAYLMPYEFWYSRTYKNWLTRLVTNPEIIAAYGKYRTALEKLHAGAPEWWKYNVNSNELLGRNDDNPLFFNLEATLNPLNGLTGIDFSDPAKRVDWLTRSVDDLGKFGPSLWTPINMALAMSLYAKGETDAAARWAGRLIPQTQLIRTIGAMLNTNVEVDPSVLFFSGGQDPYEQRRAATALAALASGTYVNGQWVQITDEQAIDAANPAIRAQNPQAQEIWDLATQYALDKRTLGSLSSFFLGVGFKGRSVSELQVDRMYQDYYKLWNAAPMMSPAEFREQMEGLRIQYPWMDAVILAKKSGPEVDRALAYNVLGRVPPGQSSDILKLFGLTPEQMEQFYTNKGDLSYMTAPDRQRFMAGIVELSAALALPENATRLEWAQVRNSYQAMNAAAEQQFGVDVWRYVDDYFALNKANPDAAKAMLAANPLIEAALNWKEQAVMSDPLLFDYYGGIDFLEKYWKGEMYEAAEAKFGASIFEVSMQYGALAEAEKELLAQYYDLKDAGDEAGAKAFRAAWLDKDSNQKDLYLEQHPELKAYWQLKEDYGEAIARKLVEFEPKLRDVSPELRPDYQPQGVYEIPAAAELGYQFEPEPTWTDYASVLSQSQVALLEDYFAGGGLSPAMRANMTRLAEQNGMSLDAWLSTLEEAYYLESVAPVQ